MAVERVLEPTVYSGCCQLLAHVIYTTQRFRCAENAMAEPKLRRVAFGMRLFC